MPSLSQLLSRHPTLLLIDAASARAQVGLWSNGAAARPVWQTSASETSVAVFDVVDELLKKAGLRIADIQAFVFCEGPGSVLGIRTVAVALRTWRVLSLKASVYSYQSLDLVARNLGDPEAKIIADARRNAWHVAQLGQPLRRAPAEELTGDRIVTLGDFRHWTPLPANVRSIPYDIEKLLGDTPDAELFNEARDPDAYMHEDPAYVTWTPQIHQAPRES